MTTPAIPLSRPFSAAREREYIHAALASEVAPGGGGFIQACQREIAESCGVNSALLTPSCTAALELAALLCHIAPGDEVIMPSYTFASTANAVVLRGGLPVFVDIRPDTFNIDETLIQAAITPRCRAIFVVHYAGVCAEMDTLREIADAHEIFLVEDAAQAYGSTYKGRPAGSLADLGCISFHYTKNITAGEGGALTLPAGADAARAAVIWEKGTNRQAFLDGQTDRYTWVDVGSSYMPSEVTAAWLLAQLEESKAINGVRLAFWEQYHAAFSVLEARVPGLRRPLVPAHCRHNGHIYYLLAPDAETRRDLIHWLHEVELGAAFHYIPLHSSPAGRRFTRAIGELPVTNDTAARLIRLPLYAGMGAEAVERVIERVGTFFGVIGLR